MKVNINTKKTEGNNNKSNLNSSPSTVNKGNKVEKNSQNKNQGKNQNA